MKICPLCGKHESEIEFAGNICKECHLKKAEVAYDPLKLEICSVCHRLRKGKTTVEFSNEEIEKQLKPRLKSKFVIKSSSFNVKEVKNAIEFKGKVVLEVDGTDAEKQVSGEIRLLKFLCTECSRKTSGYFEAIIQLRGENSTRVEMFAKGILKKIEEKSFVAKIEETTNGLDIYVGSKSSALQAVQSLKIPFTTASKLAGKKDGNDLYRTSFCVRL